MVSAGCACACVLAEPPIAFAAAAQSNVQLNAAVESALSSAIGPSQIFTLLFVTLGPFKVLAPFMQATRGAEPALRRRIALLAFVMSTLALFAGMFVGVNTLQKWQVSLPALIITGGALLFAVAFRSLIQLYDPNEPRSAGNDKPDVRTAVSPLTFPAIATPYGIAILILLKAALPASTGDIVRMLGLVMLLNLGAMLFARQILKYAGAVLQLIGTILTVLQAALGVQMLILGITTVAGAGR